MSEDTVNIIIPVERRTWNALQLLSRTMQYKTTDLMSDILCLGLRALWDTVAQEKLRPTQSTHLTMRTAIAKAVRESRPPPHSPDNRTPDN